MERSVTGKERTRLGGSRPTLPLVWEIRLTKRFVTSISDLTISTGLLFTDGLQGDETGNGRLSLLLAQRIFRLASCLQYLWSGTLSYSTQVCLGSCTTWGEDFQECGPLGNSELDRGLLWLSSCIVSKGHSIFQSLIFLCFCCCGAWFRLFQFYCFVWLWGHAFCSFCGFCCMTFDGFVAFATFLAFVVLGFVFLGYAWIYHKHFKFHTWCFLICSRPCARTISCYRTLVIWCKAWQWWWWWWWWWWWCCCCCCWCWCWCWCWWSWCLSW